MVKIIKRLVLAVFILFVLIVGSTYLWIMLNEEKLKAMIVEEINSQLDFRLDVADVSFDFFRNFPTVSLRFGEVSTVSANVAVDPVFRAASVSVLFDIIDIYRGDYSPGNLYLRDVFLYIVAYPDGSTNLQKLAGQPKAKERQKIVFNRITLKNLHVFYSETGSGTELEGSSPLLQINGEINGRNYICKTSGQCDIQSLVVKANPVLKEKSFYTDLDFKWDQGSGTFTVENGIVESGKLKMDLSGFAGTGYIDLSVSTSRTDISEYFAALPLLKTWFPMDDISIGGFLNLTAKVSGPYNDGKSPALSATFRLEKSDVLFHQYGLPIKRVFLSGNFNAPNPQNPKTYLVVVDTLTGLTNTGSFNASGHINNFQTPEVSILLQCEIDLEELLPFIPPEKVNSPGGRISLSCSYQNKFPGFTGLKPEDFRQSSSSGKIGISHGTLQLAGSNLTYSGLNGSLSFHGDDITVDKLDASIPASDFTLKGRFKNLLQWSLFSGEKLEVDASFYSGLLDLNKILDSDETTDMPRYRFQVSDNVLFNIDMNIDTLLAGRFRADGLKGRLGMVNRVLKIDNTTFSAFGGDVGIAGKIDGTPASGYIISFSAGIENADIRRVFYELNEFGQDNITSDNLGGKLNTVIDFSCRTGGGFDIEPHSVEVNAEVHIIQGELSGYAPVYRLSRFIDREELEHISFSELRNNISIRDGKVYIPQMEIESSSCNLKLEGIHTFDNNIDYHAWVSLKSLMQEPKKEDFEQDYKVVIEDDGYGNTCIPLWLQGPANNPEIRYDTRAVTKKWSDDLKKEKETLGEIFRKEFSSKAIREKEMKESPQGNGTVIIEWEEDGSQPAGNDKKTKLPSDTIRKKEGRKKNSGVIIQWDEEAPDTLKVR